MTRGAWMCRPHRDDGLQIWYVPRQNDKPCTDSERAQKWRLSLASLLFFTVLLSDYLWLCAEANLSRSRDQGERSTPAEAEATTRGNRSLSPLFLGADQPRGPVSGDQRAAFFLGNTTRSPICQVEPCRPYYVCERCVSIEDAESVCRGANQGAASRSPPPSFNNFHLSFCESYTLSELFAGMSRPEGSNCDLSLVLGGDATVCVQCVEIYQRLDQHAQEKYDEFQSLFQKYLQSRDYSVTSCIDDCKYQLVQKNSVQGLTEFQVYFNHSLAPIKLLCHILKENQLSTKPGCVPNTLRSRSFTVAPEFRASSIVPRSRHGVHLFYQTIRTLSTVDCQVFSVQVCLTIIQQMLSPNAVMSDGSSIMQLQRNNPKEEAERPSPCCVTGPP
ncbi:NALCN channel auxiliary factor 1 isoform X2 [Rhinoraja longicauda]